MTCEVFRESKKDESRYRSAPSNTPIRSSFLSKYIVVGNPYRYNI
jgi:hypothetical protein